MFIQGSEKSQEIVELVGNRFEYKKLTYVLDDDMTIPVSFEVEEKFPKISEEEYLLKGLNDEAVASHRREFGENSHKVELPDFFEFLLDKFTSPFYILQFIFCIAFIIGGEVLFGGGLIALVLVTTIINYVLLRKSYSKIQEMAERKMSVQVIRNGKTVTINND